MARSASSITFSPRMKKTSFATFSGFKTITMGESLAETFSDEKHGKRACSRGQRSEDRGTGKGECNSLNRYIVTSFKRSSVRRYIGRGSGRSEARHRQSVRIGGSEGEEDDQSPAERRNLFVMTTKLQIKGRDICGAPTYVQPRSRKIINKIGIGIPRSQSK